MSRYRRTIMIRKIRNKTSLKKVQNISHQQPGYLCNSSVKSLFLLIIFIFMDDFLKIAIAEAKAGLNEGGIPIGSVIIHKNKILGRGHNKRVQKGSVVLH